MRTLPFSPWNVTPRLRPSVLKPLQLRPSQMNDLLPSNSKVATCVSAHSQSSLKW